MKEITWKIYDFHFQAGDITEGDGRGGFSVYGRYFDDEKFALKHTKPYLLSMANKGPNSNSSQFFITTAPSPHCNDKHVVFGEVTQRFELIYRTCFQVIRGHQVVDFIENLEVDEKSKPKASVEISNCGELVKKQKKSAITEEVDASKQQDENSGIPEAPKSWLYRDEKDTRGEKKRTYARRDVRRDDRRNRDRREDRRDDRRRDDRRRSRSRSRDHRRRDRDNDRGDRRERRHDEVTVRVRGRGGVRYRRERSLTPEHWRENKPKKFVQEKSDCDSERSDRSRLI